MFRMPSATSAQAVKSDIHHVSGDVAAEVCASMCKSAEKYLCEVFKTTIYSKITVGQEGLNGEEHRIAEVKHCKASK